VRLLPHYFLLHDPLIFETQIVPAFTLSWKTCSFEPLAALAAQLKTGIAAFASKYRLGVDEPMLERIASGMQFDRAVWEMALGEALFYGAKEAPDAPVSFTSLQYLLGSRSDSGDLAARIDWPWIDRAILGSRTLRFGRGVYRPRDAGWNGPFEAVNLTAQLNGIDSEPWNVGHLEQLDASLDEEDKVDELALARDALLGIRTIYDRAAQVGYVVICEQIV
jgi:hypothetical protein